MSVMDYQMTSQPMIKTPSSTSGHYLMSRTSAPTPNPSSYYHHEPLTLEKKCFQNKQEIKPWLQGQLISKGINIVIERSDDSKIVFKCKTYNGFNNNNGHKQSKSLVKEAHKRNKSTCPFRIRANYSLRAKQWSIVIVNDNHNHPVYPLRSSSPTSLPDIASTTRSKPLLSSFHKTPSTSATSCANYNTQRLSLGGPTNSLLLAAQSMNQQGSTERQNNNNQNTTTSTNTTTSLPKFQLPLLPNFVTNQPVPVPVQTSTDILPPTSDSSISSPGLSNFSDSNNLFGSSVMSKRQASTTSSSSHSSQQQSPQLQQSALSNPNKLNLLHLDVSNMLVHLNSSNLSEFTKEDAFNRVLGVLKDTLSSPNNLKQSSVPSAAAAAAASNTNSNTTAAGGHHASSSASASASANSPTSGVNSPQNMMNYSYSNYTTTSSNLPNLNFSSSIGPLGSTGTSNGTNPGIANKDQKISLPSLTSSLNGSSSLQPIARNPSTGLSNSSSTATSTATGNNSFGQFYL